MTREFSCVTSRLVPSDDGRGVKYLARMRSFMVSNMLLSPVITTPFKVTAVSCHMAVYTKLLTPSIVEWLAFVADPFSVKYGMYPLAIEYVDKMVCDYYCSDP